MNVRKLFRAVVHPALIVPLLLASALLALAFKLGNLASVIGRVQAIPVSVMAFALGMATVYLALKAWQFRLLLSNLGVRLGWRRLVLAFAVGELSLTLPFGIFAQNWVLTSSRVARFGRSSAATVIMLLVETCIVLLLLSITGIPRWPQTRPAAAAFLAAVVTVLVVVRRFGHLAGPLARKVRQPLLRRGLFGIFDLVHGMKRLSDPKLLAATTLLAVTYLGALVLAFLAVGRAVGVQSLDYLSAATIYAFSLAVVLLCGGAITQIGTVEVLGMGAAQAWGINFTDGLALMLGFRLVWTGAIWLLNLPVVFVLWRSIRPAKRPPASEASIDKFEEAPH